MTTDRVVSFFAADGMLPAPIHRCAKRRWQHAAWLLSLWLTALSAAYGDGLHGEVIITGIGGKAAVNVRAFLSIEKERNNPSLSKARLQRLHHRARQEIRHALQPFGYYRPHIEAELSWQGATWQAHYRIDPGEPVRIRRLQLDIVGEGSGDNGLRRAMQRFPLRVGDVLLHARYESGKQNLLQEALNRGYIKARFAAHEIRVFPEENVADIRLALDSGIRFRFGKVIFSDTVIDRLLLARYSDIQAGEPYSAARLVQLQNALFSTDYFSRVEITPQVEGTQDHEVPIYVDLKPSKRHRYSAGLGYGTDTGLRGSLGYINRRLNRRGHRLRSTLRLSQLQKSLSASYIVPFRNPRRDKWEFSASLINDHPDEDQEADSYILGASRTIGLGKYWLETLYLNYRRDSFRVGSRRDDSQLLLPGLSLERTRSWQNRRQITRGSRLSLDLRAARRGLLSDISLLQPQLTAKFIVPALLKRGRLILRGEVAATIIEGFVELPPSLRYYAGGDNSVRGYGYQSLSPRNDAGERIGGRQKLVGSIEYDYRFREKWSIAAFLDTGNAFDNWDDFDLEQGAGVGIRWLSPVGPLRIDLAEALSQPGRNFRLHIVFGPEL
ncbi:MAG: autotransporter assembly complex family protein [Gammaproteobacteria bacterium]